MFLNVFYIGRGQEAKIVTLRDTPPVDQTFMIDFGTFEGADSKSRCSQVCIPAVF